MPLPTLRTLTAASVCAAALTLTGCNAGDEAPAAATTTPAQEVRAAVTALGEASTLRTTLGFDMTDQVRASLTRNAGPGLPPGLVDLLDTGSIVVVASAPTGKTLSDLPARGGAGAVSVAVDTGATNLVELRVVNHVAYLALDTDALSGLAGTDLSTPLRQAAQQSPAAAAAVKTLLAGGWLSVKEDTLKHLAPLAGMSLPARGSSSISPEQARAFSAAVVKQLQASAQITELAPERRYQVAVPVREFLIAMVDDLRAAVPASSAQQMPSKAEFVKEISAAVPADMQARVTLDVTDGVLDKVSLDLAQFLSLKQRAELALSGSTMVISLDFDTDVDAVAAPAGATSVDALLEQMTAGLTDPVLRPAPMPGSAVTQRATVVRR